MCVCVCGGGGGGGGGEGVGFMTILVLPAMRQLMNNINSLSATSARNI